MPSITKLPPPTTIPICSPPSSSLKTYVSLIFVDVEVFVITEWNDLKECDWCGGKIDKGLDFSSEVKILPRFFCSYECSRAKDYNTTLFIGVVFSLGSIVLFLGALAFPILSAPLLGGEVFIILLLGQFIGWPLMWCAKDSRNFRKAIPRDSRRERLVGEPLD
jgi:hypothetical protein